MIKKLAPIALSFSIGVIATSALHQVFDDEASEVSSFISKESSPGEKFVHSFQKNIMPYVGSGIEVAYVAKDSKSRMNLVKLTNGSIFLSDDNAEMIVANLNGSPFSMLSPQEDGLLGYADNLLSDFYAQSLKKVEESDGKGILVKSKNEKFVVTAFIDPACSYCQKMNSEIQQYLDKGISINYVPLPVFGARSSQILHYIFSNAPEDQYKILNLAEEMIKADRSVSAEDIINADRLSSSGAIIMKNENLSQKETLEELGLFETKVSAVSKVDAYTALAKLLGIEGTPAIWLQNGQLVRHYISADKLLEMLNKEGPLGDKF